MSVEARVRKVEYLPEITKKIFRDSLGKSIPKTLRGEFRIHRRPLGAYWVRPVSSEKLVVGQRIAPTEG